MIRQWSWILLEEEEGGGGEEVTPLDSNSVIQLCRLIVLPKFEELFLEEEKRKKKEREREREGPLLFLNSYFIEQPSEAPR